LPVQPSARRKLEFAHLNVGFVFEIALSNVLPTVSFASIRLVSDPFDFAQDKFSISCLGFPAEGRRLALIGFVSAHWQGVRFLHNPLSKLNLPEFYLADKLALF